MSVVWNDAECVPTAARGAIERWLAGEARERPLAASARRQVLAIEADGQPAVAIKRYETRRGRRSGDAIKRAIGNSPAAREWKTLCALQRAGVAIATPYACALRSRDAPSSADTPPEWIALQFLAGEGLGEALARRRPRERHALLQRLGEALRALHASGYAHRDLHVGNIVVVEDQPLLLDLEKARATTSATAHERDIASLDFSLARAGLGRAGRLRLRRAALPAPDRDSLRRVGRLAREREADYARGRTRRCLVEGRRFARIEDTARTGMRLRTYSEASVNAALDAHARALEVGGAAVLKDDARSRVTRVQTPAETDALGGPLRTLIVKEVTKAGLGRRVADTVRGSPARRGWVAGHGLAARGIGAARPCAFVEMRARGLSERSFLLLEDVGAASWLEANEGPTSPDALADALLRLLVALHRQGVDHGDLQITHVYGRKRARLIDLEGVRFGQACNDAQRIRGLAELNASLPDALLSPALRRETFDRYARALPFDSAPEVALRAVVAQSLERRHRWRGTDCDIAAALSAPR